VVAQEPTARRGDHLREGLGGVPVKGPRGAVWLGRAGRPVDGQLVTVDHTGHRLPHGRQLGEHHERPVEQLAPRLAAVPSGGHEAPQLVVCEGAELSSFEQRAPASVAVLHR